jgi:hypothetical protein
VGAEVPAMVVEVGIAGKVMGEKTNDGLVEWNGLIDFGFAILDFGLGYGQRMEADKRM